MKKEDKNKTYTYAEVQEMFRTKPECDVKDTCDYFDTWKCGRCLRNKFHLTLEDHYKMKPFTLKGISDDNTKR